MLLKRRMLMQAGWPRQALLITVVRDKKGEGHAVLTVKTDKGEFILDNQNERNPALVRDRLPLREAPVAVRSECLGRARRSAAAPVRTAITLALTDTEKRSYALPVTSPPLPVPRPGSRAAGLPQGRPHLFGRTGPARRKRHANVNAAPDPQLFSSAVLLRERRSRARERAHATAHRRDQGQSAPIASPCTPATRASLARPTSACIC